MPLRGAEIAKAEAGLGFKLPEDFKASYRIHNGGGSGVLMDFDTFFDISGVVQRSTDNVPLMHDPHFAEKVEACRAR